MTGIIRWRLWLWLWLCLALALALGRGLSASGSMTFTRGDEHVDGGLDVPFTRIPPVFGRLKLRYETGPGGGWQAFAESWVQGAARQDHLSAEDEKDTRIPAGGTPGWWTWSARAGLHAFESLTLGLVLENLGDVAYKTHGSGVHASGTNVVLTVEVLR